MTFNVVDHAQPVEALRRDRLALLQHAVELLDERLAEILKWALSPDKEARTHIGVAAARAEVNVDQIRYHLARLGIVLTEPAEPNIPLERP